MEGRSRRDRTVLARDRPADKVDDVRHDAQVDHVGQRVDLRLRQLAVLREALDEALHKWKRIRLADILRQSHCGVHGAPIDGAELEVQKARHGARLRIAQHVVIVEIAVDGLHRQLLRILVGKLVTRLELFDERIHGFAADVELLACDILVKLVSIARRVRAVDVGVRRGGLALKLLDVELSHRTQQLPDSSAEQARVVILRKRARDV